VILVKQHLGFPTKFANPFLPMAVFANSRFCQADFAKITPKLIFAKDRFCQNLYFPSTVFAKTTGSAKKRSFECELHSMRRRCCGGPPFVGNTCVMEQVHANFL